MKKLMAVLLFTFLFSSRGYLIAQDIGADEILGKVILSCGKSIEKVVDSRIYLEKGHLWFFHGSYYILNDSEQWIPLGMSPLHDSNGYYMSSNQGYTCPLGHSPAARVNGQFYCLTKPKCPYYYGKIPD